MKKTRTLSKPNIIFIVADDLGWNEVSWHNDRFHTPNLEELSAQGVRLSRSYVSPKCSPSRAALLTGMYPWKLGMQRGAVERFHPTGLNTSIPTLPELLKQAGYKNYLVGKWHLGYCHEAFLPNNRGFDYFFGQYNHMADYYHRKIPASKLFTDLHGRGAHDLHENFEPSYEGDGEFSPDLYSRYLPLLSVSD